MAALSLEKIEAIAPDQASLSAARKLLKPGVWSGLQSDGAELAWGECQGSGATPYRVAISETDAGYKCTCPSRKFPCKHCLALMWMRAEGKT
ncbi:MAG: SWIM zinc finger family protein, partial [Terracidiphilus sp.]